MLNGIDNALKSKGLSRQDLADHLHVSTTSIGRYVSGDRQPPFEILKEICEYLSISSDVMLNIKNAQGTLPDDEVTLLERYRKLDVDGQEILRAKALEMTKEYSKTNDKKAAV